jgi:phosphatidylglycerophosphate synthase
MVTQHEIRLTGRAKTPERRPIGLRDLASVRTIASWLVRVGVTPNQISILGMGFSALSATCLLLTPGAEPVWRGLLFLAAAAFIPLRGLCNLCDGLMAVEGGLKTKLGEIFNDLPDRLSDTLMLVAAGAAAHEVAWGEELGWSAALLAALTAYVRVLGAATGAAQQFCGPMAKTHRMIVLGAACLVAAVESAAELPRYAMAVGLVVVVTGCVVTIVRRTARIVRELEAS